jgi:hypothetical protein
MYKNIYKNLYCDGGIKICVLLCWCVGFTVMAKWESIVFRIVLIPGNLVFLSCRLRNLCRVICNSRFRRYKNSVVYVHYGGVKVYYEVISLTYLHRFDGALVCCYAFRLSWVTFSYLFLCILLEFDVDCCRYYVNWITPVVLFRIRW